MNSLGHFSLFLLVVDATATIEVFDSAGARLASKQETIRAKQRRSALLTEYFPALLGREIDAGYIKVASDRPGFALFGTRDLSVLSAIPPQGIP